MTNLEIYGRLIELTDLDTVMYPGEDVMKGDVLHYYFRVARTMTRHVRGRLMSVHRYPNGIWRIDSRRIGVSETCPDWIQATWVEGAEHQGRQIVVDEPAALAYLAETSCITPYVWPSPGSLPTRPDRIVFDIDPPRDHTSEGGLCSAAHMLREEIEDAGLCAFVMTSGARGLHVHVPIWPELEFDVVIAFARSVAESVANRAPDRVTTDTHGAAVADKVVIGYMRNCYGMTSVAPYGLRALKGAPVATPLEWEEVTPRLDPRAHNRSSVLARLARAGDPWRKIAGHTRSLRRVRVTSGMLAGVEHAWRPHARSGLRRFSRRTPR